MVRQAWEQAFTPNKAEVLLKAVLMPVVGLSVGQLFDIGPKTQTRT